MTDQCPVCEIGTLSPSTWQHKGLELECYKCCECGADPVFADQIQRNHERLQMTDQQDITRAMSELDQLRLNYIESLQGENKRLNAELERYRGVLEKIANCDVYEISTHALRNTAKQALEEK